MVTEGSILGGRGRRISYLLRSTLEEGVNLLWACGARSYWEKVLGQDIERRWRGFDLPNPHPLFDICGGHALTKLDNKLSDLLDIDDIFALFGFFLILYYLGTAGDLERVVFGHALAVCGDVP